jgi:hypothetical protein
MIVWSSKRALVLTAILLGFASNAAAQELGVRAGVSSDPDQFYFGVHVYTAPIVDRLRFRPNLEIGVGDDTTLAALNLEFVYPLRITRSQWSFLPGAGPALNIYNHGENTDTDGGFNILLGLEHRDGFFVEMKVGAMDSPDLKFGVGYTFGRR